jgi:hypothetical protein
MRDQPFASQRREAPWVQSLLDDSMHLCRYSQELRVWSQVWLDEIHRQIDRADAHRGWAPLSNDNDILTIDK